MSLIQLLDRVGYVSLATDVRARKRCRETRCDCIRDSCSHPQSGFTLDQSALIGECLNFFSVSYDILFVHFQVAYSQPSKTTFRKLFKPSLELLYSQSSRAVLHSVTGAHCCQFCFPAAGKEEFTQMGVLGTGEFLLYQRLICKRL